MVEYLKLFFGLIIKYMENKKIPTHDPYTGDLNPYYEELTGEQNPLIVMKGDVHLDIKTPNYEFFKIKSEEFCCNRELNWQESLNSKTAFMEGVKSVMKEILTNDEYFKFVKNIN